MARTASETTEQFEYSSYGRKIVGTLMKKGKNVERIGLFTTYTNQERVYSVQFQVGDEAVFDSYNLIYTGTIVSITDKSVTIKPRYREGNRRLKLTEFAWRNYDFDAERIAAQNAETSMYI